MQTRRVLVLLGTGALAASIIPRRARALDAPRPPLLESEPAATRVAYVADATQVDQKRFPAYRRGQTCANCQFVEFGTARQRGCVVIPDRLVMAGGWCTLWKLRGAK